MVTLEVAVTVGRKFNLIVAGGLVHLQRHRNGFRSSEPKNVRRGEVKRPARWTGPLAVLETSTAVSAGENLADLLQAKQRAVIVGEPTAGALESGHAEPAG